MQNNIETTPNKHIETIKEIILEDDSRYKLLKYTKFDLEELMQTDDDGWVYLERVLMQAPPKIIKHVIDHAINFNACDEENFQLVHYLCKYNKFDILVQLVNKGVIDLEACDDEWYRPIHFALSYSGPEIIKFLIEKGVDMESQTIKGLTSVKFAAKHSTPEIIKFIIEKGVDLEKRDQFAMTLIHYVCIYSTPEIIKYVIDRGVDLEAVDCTGSKPIHLICQYSTPEMLRYIVSKNIDLDSADNNGKKPMHFVCESMPLETIQYFFNAMLHSKNLDQQKRIMFLTKDLTEIYSLLLNNMYLTTNQIEKLILALTNFVSDCE